MPNFSTHFNRLFHYSGINADRLFETRFYIPLADFCRLGISDIQQDQRIGMIYSQAAGLFFFLVHYDDGRYRDAVVAYLNDVYNGRDTTETLSKLTGQSYEALDRQYAEFMRQVPGT